eukprot:CAMPEP_0181113258 /NCGR_PEP_ID=MMETSP1071-20121207/20252_1 /TAXON_ID=35127 /ORGANISM="Thalassiosira sp., Strain NH16" /LENGTH=276 /DNA_ID=CAMNT_0023197285 /DNA_START=36 /DNA_END=863 /DNA_ORIENTATION=+
MDMSLNTTTETIAINSESIATTVVQSGEAFVAIASLESNDPLLIVEAEKITQNKTIESNAVVESTAPAVKNDKAAKTSLKKNESPLPLMVRQMTGEAPKSSSVVTRGKENNKIETLIKTKAEIASSRSMKQSLVSMAKSHKQRESNAQTSKQGKKKTTNLKRLERLAQPRKHQSIMARPVINPSPMANVKKKCTKASTSGPPSFLSRSAASHRHVKSTTELKKEEKDRIKPFKAQKILGSSVEVKSRFKTTKTNQPQNRPTKGNGRRLQLWAPLPS